MEDDEKLPTPFSSKVEFLESIGYDHEKGKIWVLRNRQGRVVSAILLDSYGNIILQKGVAPIFKRIDRR